MGLHTYFELVTNDASATQTLPEAVVAVDQVLLTEGGATATTVETLTVVQGAPAAGQAQFTGTCATPSNAVVLSAAPAAAGKLVVRAVLPGAIPTYR